MAAAAAARAGGVTASAAAAVPPPSAAPVIEPLVFDDPRLSAFDLYPHFIERLNQEFLLPVWRRWRARRWAAWTVGADGNPFVVKITRANAKDLGVPTYFDIVKVPMDLTRMLERLEGKGGKRYGSPEEFLADAALIISNAKAFNCPATARGPDGALPTVLPHPAVLPPEQRPAGSVYCMAWEFEADIHAATLQVVRQWRAREVELRRQVMEDAHRLQQEAAAGRPSGAGAATAAPIS